jgi:hypothetical protein
MGEHSRRRSPRRLGRPVANAKPGSILFIEGQQDIRSRESSSTVVLQQPVRGAAPCRKEDNAVLFDRQSEL